ncbi:hypothetical protein BASA83_002558 [Batrachochytrium salamandrivorans]|nr:hypothetical protein BASA83_002558 [Batrachochytrium salamandrivorans]
MFGPALTLVLALASSSVIAVPMIDNVYKRAVASLDSSSTEFPFHFPESVYESIPQSGDAPSSSPRRIMSRLPLISSPKGSISTRMISRWSIPTLTMLAAAHAKNGQVTCFSSSFGTDQHLAKRDLAVSEPKATMSFEEVSSIVSAKLEIPVYSDFEHTLEYVAQSDGKVVYSYKFQLRNDLVTKWIEGGVMLILARRDAHVSLHDTTLNRTPGFDNTVVVHEYAHGISNRLTGGAAIGGCFTTFEAGGVDEGWGDVMAMMVLAKESDTATTGMPISAGNVVAMKIFIGGLTLQPCNPGLLGARNAIIDADKLHYNGTPQVRDLQGICQAWPRLQDHQRLHR